MLGHMAVGKGQVDICKISPEEMRGIDVYGRRHRGGVRWYIGSSARRDSSVHAFVRDERQKCGGGVGGFRRPRPIRVRSQAIVVLGTGNCPAHIIANWVYIISCRITVIPWHPPVMRKDGFPGVDFVEI